MRIKNTAFIYNVTVNGSSNCDWGTDIGQGAKHTFTLDGFPEIINAMVYYKIKDVDGIKVILGKGNRTPKRISEYDDTELVLASCFKKIYVNNVFLAGQNLIMYIVKEINKFNSKGQINVHQNRCTLKFSNSLLYNDVQVNQNCINAISQAFGQTENGSWAILEMKIENEDELHLYGFAFGDNPKVYSSTEERNSDFASRFDKRNALSSHLTNNIKVSHNFQLNDVSYISAIKAKPFLILGGFSGTGKSQKVKELAYATCPCDGKLNTKKTSPGNYLLISVKPNWHDATDITGFRSSVNNNYYVTDFMRFLIKAKQYPDVPFFVCLDEMNLAPVEEYFAEFLSVIESRKLDSSGKIVTDPIVSASVFCDDYDPNFNIFLKLGLETINTGWKADDLNDLSKEEQEEAFVRQDIVEELKRDGLTIPQNVIIIGTVNMDDTTNSFSRKVIDRAMTFETIVEEITDKYFDEPTKLGYVENPLPGEMFISSFVRADDINPDFIDDQDREDLKEFINGINQDLNGTPFKISYRVLNETILLYRAKWDLATEYNEKYPIFTEDAAKLNVVFDDILMQKVLPRIEGDYDKCHDCLVNLQKRAKEKDWTKSQEKIQFMLDRFGNDKSGFTTFWN